MCRKAAQEIREAGGVKVGSQTVNFDCVAYDNKYTAAEGAKVALFDIDLEGARRVAETAGGGAIALRCDVTNVGEIEAAVARLVSPEKGLQLASGKIDGMGELFKVLCVTAPGLAEPAGFEPVRS